MTDEAKTIPATRSRPGRPAQPPAVRLREAAVLFAAAVELGDDQDVRVQWDRLRHAALAYRDGPRPRGRPRKDG